MSVPINLNLKINNSSIKLVLAVTIFFVLVGMNKLSVAAPVDIVNPGFEAFQLEEGQYSRPFDGHPGAILSLDPIPGWTLDSSTGDGGTVNLTEVSYPDGAPEGENVAYSSRLTTPPKISQILNASLNANTIYTLTVDIGRRLDNDFPGYAVQLLAGGNILAEDNNNFLPKPGQFIESIVTYSSGSTGSFLGDPLEIKFWAFDGGQVNFDDVRLDATVVPIPGAMWLLGAGVVCLLGFRRKSNNQLII